MIGVTALQAELVLVARAFELEHGCEATASDLAIAADVAAPLVWEALKSLERVGCIAWKRTVHLVAGPDGILFVLGGA